MAFSSHRRSSARQTLSRKRRSRSSQRTRLAPYRWRTPSLELLEARRMLAIDTPVILIPGFGGTMPGENVDLQDWLTQRGSNPQDLQVDPLAHAYDNLIHTLDAVGYTRDQDLFVANWDWRVPVAQQDDTTDGTLAGITAEDIIDDTYDTGLDYLGYWLKMAADAWNAADHDTPLTSVDIIAHSTGGLVARSYLQSSAYGQSYDSDGDGTIDGSLPTIDNLVLVGVPNEGAGDVWNILQNDFNGSLASRGLGLLTHSAWDLFEQGQPILAPDGTPMSAANQEEFIAQYIGSAVMICCPPPISSTAISTGLTSLYRVITQTDFYRI